MIKFKNINKIEYVDLKSIHDTLGIKTKFTDWIRRRMSKCNFNDTYCIKEKDNKTTSYYFKKEDALKILEIDKDTYDITSIANKLKEKKQTKEKTVKTNITKNTSDNSVSMLSVYRNLFNKILDDIDEKLCSFSTANDIEMEMLRTELSNVMEENSKLKHEISVIKNIGRDEVSSYKVDGTIKLDKKRITIENIWKNTQHKHKLSQNDFIDLLINKGYIFRQRSKGSNKGTLTASSDCVKKGLMYMEEQTFTTNKGYVGSRHQLVFTAEGEKFITDYIKKMYP